MKRARFLDPAEEEMFDAAGYYEIRTKNLGKEFLREVQMAIEEIEENPVRWPIGRYGVRQRLLSRFPYTVIYRAEVEEVVIVAIMHAHRRPFYWKNRL